MIADESALHVLLHGDWAFAVGANLAKVDPLIDCASTLEGLTAFNTSNPLYGPPPISLLVDGKDSRRFSGGVICRFTAAAIPPNSYWELRDGLYVLAPGFAYARMAKRLGEVALAEIATNLCARYYIDALTGRVCDRADFIATPEQLRSYVSAVPTMRGARKAVSALRWVLPNSASPYETKTMLLFRLSPAKGGFGLPFTVMNFDVSAGRLRRITSQSGYSIDLADIQRKVGLEFDGEDYHQDAGKDKRRRNELEAMGWAIFPVDKHVLHDSEATIRVAEQMAKRMGIRLRHSANWEAKYLRLRSELGLTW